MHIRVILEYLKDQNNSFIRWTHVVLLSSKITQKGVTNIAELESNFKMDQVEQKLPDVYCQHQNPDGVLNIGYTRIGLQFSSAITDWIIKKSILIG